MTNKQNLLCKVCKKPLTEFLETIHFNMCTPCFIEFMNAKFERFDRSKEEYYENLVKNKKRGNHGKKKKQKKAEA